MQHHRPSSGWHEPTPPPTPGSSTQASASGSSLPRKFLHYYFDRRCREHAAYDCPTCIADYGDQQPSNTFLHRSSATNGNAPVINPPSSSSWNITVPLPTPLETLPGPHRHYQHSPPHLPFLANDSASSITSAAHPRIGSLTAANRWRHNRPIRSSTAEEIAARDKLEADQKQLDDEKSRLESEQQQKAREEEAAKAEAEQKKRDAEAVAAAAATKQAEEAEAERKTREAAAVAEAASAQLKLIELTEQVALLQQQQQQEQKQREGQIPREEQHQQQPPAQQPNHEARPASSSPFPPPPPPLRSSSSGERTPSRLQRIRQKAADLVRGGSHGPVSS
ncbi:hypothetical protein Slin15195_G051160 [Septoria linicola]|uniref:Uncharacterized protein n=1 Tax=Septoria linicola TaxID=215465 RepID=A0A9Q9EJ56_9PEZI|nr:hypothetical protein Slin15195_G051160 [Septoria linicola]